MIFFQALNNKEEKLKCIFAWFIIKYQKNKVKV